MTALRPTFSLDAGRPACLSPDVRALVERAKAMRVSSQDYLLRTIVVFDDGSRVSEVWPCGMTRAEAIDALVGAFRSMLEAE